MDTDNAQIGGRYNRFSLRSHNEEAVELLSKAVCKPCEVKLIRLSKQDLLKFCGAATKQTQTRKRHSRRPVRFATSIQRAKKNRIYKQNLRLRPKSISGDATNAQAAIDEGKQEDIFNLSTSIVVDSSVKPIRQQSEERTFVTSVPGNETPKPQKTSPSYIKRRRSSKTAEDGMKPVLKKRRGVKSLADDTTQNIVVEGETDNSKYALATGKKQRLQDQEHKQTGQDKSNVSKNLRVSLIKLEDLASSSAHGMRKTKIQNGRILKRRRREIVQQNTLLNYFHAPYAKPLERRPNRKNMKHVEKEPKIRQSKTLDERLLEKYKLVKEPKIILERVDTLHNVGKTSQNEDKWSENCETGILDDKVGSSNSVKDGTNKILEKLVEDSPPRSSPILGKKLPKRRLLTGQKNLASTEVTLTTSANSFEAILTENVMTNTKDNMEETSELIEDNVEVSKDSLATYKNMTPSTVEQVTPKTTSSVESEDTTAERSSSPILVRSLSRMRSPRKQYPPTFRNTSVSPRNKRMERSESPSLNNLSIGARIQVFDRSNDTSNINSVTADPQNQVSTQDVNLSPKAIDVASPRSPNLLHDKTSAVPRTITPIPSRHSGPILARRAISSVRRSQTPTVFLHKTPTPPRSRNQTPTLCTTSSSLDGSPINSLNESCDSSSNTKFSICLPSRVPVTSLKKTAVCSPRRTLFFSSDEDPACSLKHAVDSEVNRKELSIDVERKQSPKANETVSTSPAHDHTITNNEKEVSNITAGDAISTEITPSATRQRQPNVTELSGMNRTISDAAVVNLTAMSEDLLTKRSTSTICKNAPAKSTKISGTPLVLERSETKSLQNEDQSESSHVPEIYKCIVCDVLFASYSILQEHLRVHTQKKNSTAGISSKDTSPIIHKTSDLSNKQTFQATGMPHSASCEDPESASLSSENNQKNRSSDACIPFESTENATNSTETPEIEEEQEATNCGVCLETFESVKSLADHIFTHTGTELQAAFETSRKKNDLQQKSLKTTKASTTTSALANDRENVINQPTQSNDLPKDQTNILSENVENNVEENEHTTTVDKEKSLPSGSNSVSTSGKHRNKIKVKTKNSDPSRKPKSAKSRVGSSKQSIPHESSNSVEPVSKITQYRKIACKKLPASASTIAEEGTMITDVIKPITVCQCHLTDVTYGNSLRIEVALLCHTCRVLYRSMECFETHYRLLEHALCTKNRLHGRSAKLFCSNCGMIFSSLQDVRQHLEIHARFNNCVTTDFRCDLCKVIFIGIGSLFYTHWSNHQKDPFFLASRFTFPKSSIVTPKDTQANSENIRDYLHVAEHICLTCRVPFTTEAHLLQHKPDCQSASTTGRIISTRIANCNDEPKRTSKLQLICGMCNRTFEEASFLRQHIRKHHYHYEKPRYLRLYLRHDKVAFMCGACGSIHETADDFKTHWDTHNPTREYFICTNCGDRVQDLEAFMSHAITHKSTADKDLPQCRVSCFGSDLICKACNLCFATKEQLRKHKAYKKCFSEKSVRTDIPLVRNVISSVVTDNTQMNQMCDKNQVQPEVRVETVNVAKQNEANDTNKSVGDKESNKSVNNTAADAETSDGELVIDLDSSEDEGPPNEKRQQKTSGNMTKTVKPLQSAMPITEEATYPEKIQNNNQNQQATEQSTINQQVETQNVTTDADNYTTKEQTAENVTKPIQPTSATSAGTNKTFLRVKPLAELTAKRTYYHCAACNICFLYNREFENHLETHKASAATNIVLKSDRGITNRSLLSGGTSTLNSAVPHSINSLLDGPTQSYAKSPGIRRGIVPSQFRPPPQTGKQEQQATWHIREETQSAVQKKSESEKSAYHKNLPPCNIGRPPVAAALRLSARQNSAPSESSVRASVSETPVCNSSTSTRPTGAQQQQERSTVESQQELNSIFILTPVEPVNTNNVMKKPMSAIRIPLNAQQQQQLLLPHLKQNSPNRYTCTLCPEFKCNNVVEYTKHELSELHKVRVKLRNTVFSESPKNDTLGIGVNQGVYVLPPAKTTSHTGSVGFSNSTSQVPSPSRTEDQQKLRPILPNSKQSHPQWQGYQSSGCHPQSQFQEQAQPQIQSQQQAQSQLQTQQTAQSELQTQQQEQTRLQTQQPLEFQQQAQVYQVCQSDVCNEPIVYLAQPATQQRVDYTVPNVMIDNTNVCQNMTTVYPQNLTSVTTTENFYPTITLDDTCGISVVPNNVTYAPSGSTYNCPHCSRIRFPTESLLRNHVDIYHTYICEYCGLRLYRITDLDRHKLTHQVVWGKQCKSK